MLSIKSDLKRIRMTKSKWTVTGFHIPLFVVVKTIAYCKAFNPFKFYLNYFMVTLLQVLKLNIFWNLELPMSSTLLQNNTQKDTNIFSTWILICIITMRKMQKNFSEFQTDSLKMQYNKEGKYSYIHLFYN